MTQILFLAQYGSSSAFVVTTNADWRDTIPLGADLTGISFSACMRAEVTGSEVFLDMTTDNGLLINGGISGELGIQVPVATMVNVDPGSYVLDIVAVGDGVVVNIFPEGPAAVMVNEGVTR
jgi:hypothetical protein